MRPSSVQDELNRFRTILHKYGFFEGDFCCEVTGLFTKPGIRIHPIDIIDYPISEEISIRCKKINFNKTYLSKNGSTWFLDFEKDLKEYLEKSIPITESPDIAFRATAP